MYTQIKKTLNIYTYRYSIYDFGTQFNGRIFCILCEFVALILAKQMAEVSTCNWMM